MPLTLAHPAIIVPLRKRFVFSALVVGSIVPDFAKIFSLSPAVSLGHTWPGIFWFSLPVGLVTLLVFHGLLKKPLFLLLPRTHQERLRPFLNEFTWLPWSRLLAISGAIILGAATHLLWDSFTHHDTWGVENFTFLQSEILRIEKRSIRLFQILQLASSLGGILFLIWFYFRFYQSAPVHPLDSLPEIPARKKILLYVSAVAMSLLPAMMLAAFTTQGRNIYSTIKHFAGRAAVYSIAFFILEIIVFSLVCHFWLKPKVARQK